MDNSNEKHSNEAQTQPSCLGAVSGWVAVTDALPKALQTVWLTNGKGWVCLGCLVEDAEGWHWAESNGVIYIENGEIVSECESEDLDVNFWHELPKPQNVIGNAICALHDGWLDWNTLSLDQMVEYLRKKYMFSSSGDAKCIYHLIDFYDKHK